MKIFNIITGGLRREGITSTQFEFVNHMQKDDLTIDFAATFHNDPTVIKEFRDAGYRVIDFPDRHKKILFYIISMFKVMRKEKYDIVHVHGSSALMVIELFIAKMLRIPVRIAHSRNTLTSNPKLDKILRPIFYKCYTHAFACGEDAGKWLFQNRDFIVIHNGKDLEKFKYNSTTRELQRRKYGINEEVCIGFVGNLNPQKNVKFLIDIFEKIYKKNNNTKLFIIGDGEERDILKTKAKDCGIGEQVIFTGHINNMNEVLQAMDIMVLPSLYEGLPNVVLEWQAAGLKSFVSMNVTQECAVVDYVKFLPIDQGTDIWVDQILKNCDVYDRNKFSYEGCNKLIEERFEINEASEYVRNLYFESLKEY